MALFGNVDIQLMEYRLEIYNQDYQISIIIFAIRIFDKE